VTVPSGRLPVFSVDTEEEAEQLLNQCCERVTYGPDYRLAWIAAELEQEQTLDNLFAFGNRLKAAYEKLNRSKS
jgi:hypothetical protein